MSRRGLIAATIVAGVVTVGAAAGTVAIAAQAPGGASFGWFAYQPLSTSVFSPVAAWMAVSPWLIPALTLTGVALAVTAFLLGRLSVRRTAADR